jgi:hypothetical protein
VIVCGRRDDVLAEAKSKGLHTIKAGLKRGETEIGYGFSEKARNASRAEHDAISARMAQR